MTEQRTTFLDLFRGRMGGLAFGLMLLEFVASVQTFVVSTVLPDVAIELNGGRLYGIAVSIATLSVFISLPLTARLSQRYGMAKVLNISAITYIAGAALTALSPSMEVFISGRFVQGMSSGALAAFGLSAVVKAFPERLRPRLFALMSSMWLIPALVGPLATAAITPIIGWRWMLASLIPLVLIGRLFVIGKLSVIQDTTQSSAKKPLKPLPTLLLIGGLAGVLFAGTSTTPLHVVVGGVGMVLSIVGATMALPKGTLRARRGTPAALGAFTILTLCFFGGNGLITLLAREGLDVGLTVSATALGAGTVAWVLASLLQPRLLELLKSRFNRVAILSSVIVSIGFALLVVALAIDAGIVASSALCIGGWSIAGLGMGLGYPTLSVSAMNGAAEHEADSTASSVVLAENFGGAIGLSVGGSLVAVAVASTGRYESGLLGAFAVFLAGTILYGLFASRIENPSQRTE